MPDTVRLLIFFALLFGALFIGMVALFWWSSQSFWFGFLTTLGIYVATVILVAVVILGVAWSYDFNWEAFYA